MNINYKATTVILLILLVVTSLALVCSSFHNTWQKKYARKDFGMHMMSDKMMKHQNRENEERMEKSSESMGSMMMGMSANLKGKTGDELDKAFLSEMIVHHAGAVEMAKLLQTGTKRPELQKMAVDIITVQTAEIEMMKKWQSEWFATSTK